MRVKDNSILNYRYLIHLQAGSRQSHDLALISLYLCASCIEILFGSPLIS